MGAACGSSHPICENYQMSRGAGGFVLFSAGLLALACVCLPAEPASFRFAILGDRTGEAQPGVYEQVWREIDAWRPEMVINVGDTIQGGNDRTAAAEWTALRPLFLKYNRYPLYFTPGNHDIWSPASRAIYEKQTRRPAHYSFDFRGAHFVVLDNSQREDLTEIELDFLEKDLASRRGKPPTFIFFHKPFWLLRVMFRADFPLHRIAVKYGVAYVVSGHSHRFGRFVHDGITYLMVGSSGGHLRGTGFEDGWFFHHVRATVTGGRVQVTIKEADAPFGKGRSFTGEQWGSGPVMRSSAADGK